MLSWKREAAVGPMYKVAPHFFRQQQGNTGRNLHPMRKRVKKNVEHVEDLYRLIRNA